MLSRSRTQNEPPIGREERLNWWDCVGGSIGNSHTNEDFLSLGHMDGSSEFGKSHGQIATQKPKDSTPERNSISNKIIMEHTIIIMNFIMLCNVCKGRLKENSSRHCCLHCQFVYRFLCVIGTVFPSSEKISVAYNVKP